MLTTTTCPSEHDVLTLDLFLADDRPDLARLYCAGHTESMRRFTGKVTTCLDTLRGACVVLARDRDGRAHGGMRVHPRRPGERLPVERALGDLCAVGEAIARVPGPLVELCGTWIAAEFRGTELVAAVTRAALAAARALGARRIVGCAHQHIFPFYRRFGAVADPTLGVHPYPDPRYETKVFWADPGACPDSQEAVDAFVDRIVHGEPLTYLRERQAA